MTAVGRAQGSDSLGRAVWIRRVDRGRLPRIVYIPQRCLAVLQDRLLDSFTREVNLASPSHSHNLSGCGLMFHSSHIRPAGLDQNGSNRTRAYTTYVRSHLTLSMRNPYTKQRTLHALQKYGLVVRLHAQHAPARLKPARLVVAQAWLLRVRQRCAIKSRDPSRKHTTTITFQMSKLQSRHSRKTVNTYRSRDAVRVPEKSRELASVANTERERVRAVVKVLELFLHR